MLKNSLDKRHPARGQGLVEYALILGLVAIVVLVIIGMVGLAAQKNIGLTAAIFGAQRANSQNGLAFNYNPRCGYLAGQGTGIYAEISTSIPASDLTAATDGGIPLALVPIAGGFKVQHQTILATNEDLSKCPHGMVVQSSVKYGGQTILFPVEIKSW